MATASGVSVIGVQTVLAYPAAEPWLIVNLSSRPRQEVRRQGYVMLVRPYESQNLDLQVKGKSLWMQGLILHTPEVTTGTMVVKVVWRFAGIPWVVASYTGLP